MAPPPEYDKEPKAPDKSAIIIHSDDSKALHNTALDQNTNSDNKPLNTASSNEVEHKPVESLDDEKLKALLDEAITYKCPKDREGKSSLFKELLDEVEQDEQEAAARSFTARAQARRLARNRHALPHSNSLQDLVAALAAEPAPRRVRHPPAPAVSARALHGGSLPDTSFLLSEEPARAGYLATVRCVNPPPLSERRLSTTCNEEVVLPPSLRRQDSNGPVFTVRADLEIGQSGRALTTTSPSNQVDSTITYSCLTSQEVASFNQSPAVQALEAVDPKPLQLDGEYREAASVTSEPGTEVSDPTAPNSTEPNAAEQSCSFIASSLNGLLVRSYGATSATLDHLKKSLDENGNAVQGFSSPLSAGNLHKKRRKKSNKNETLIEVDTFNNYHGNKNIDEILRFIDPEAAELLLPRPKFHRTKHHTSHDDNTKKRERRKDKEPKIKRATSMEEISRTKLDDLTDKPGEKERWPEVKAERRSWGDDARESFFYRDEPPELELTEFQTVTKKRKPRRRTDETPRPALLPSPPPAPRPRRESAPPSDRSNDSNDDQDSVHSLSTPAPLPHVSYADIARTRHNIPDLIESCNFYAEGEGDSKKESLPPAPGDADGYPALCSRRVHKPHNVIIKQKKPVESRPVECPAPDVVSDRRPPVILLDSSSRPRDMDGVTFGFDINEQLLSDGSRRGRCDLLQDAEEGVGCGGVGGGGPNVRYLPPPAPATHQLHQIIDYVGSAWEEVVRCGNDQVRYFSECCDTNTI